MESEILGSKGLKRNPLYRFYNTLEGSIIEFIRNQGQVSLHQIIEHVENKKERLRTISSKKYKKESVEGLVFPVLLTKKQIFYEISVGVWTININAAMEYEQKVIEEMERKKEKNNQERSERSKEHKIKLQEQEKFKIFEKNIESDIYNKLDQLVEIMESSNEEIQKQLIAFMEQYQIQK